MEKQNKKFCIFHGIWEVGFIRFWIQAMVLLSLAVMAPIHAAEQAGKASSEFLTQRSVEIEWDSVPGAVRYDLEIYDGKHKKFIKTFTSKTNLFKLNVRMGKYYFRSRIFDQYNRSSQWSELAEIVIAPPPTEILTRISEDHTVFADKKSGLYEQVLSWKELPGIETYKVIQETLDGQIVQELKVTGNRAKVKVPPGQYQFRVQAVLADGTAGDASAATPTLSVLGAQIQPPVVKFRKAPQRGPWISVRSELKAALFDGELFYKPLEGTEWVKVEELRDRDRSPILLDERYKPGLYRLRFQAKAPGFTPSKYGECEFVLKPKEQDLRAIAAPLPSIK